MTYAVTPRLTYARLPLSPNCVRPPFGVYFSNSPCAQRGAFLSQRSLVQHVSGAQSSPQVRGHEADISGVHAGLC